MKRKRDKNTDEEVGETSKKRKKGENKKVQSTIDQLSEDMVTRLMQ